MTDQTTQDPSEEPDGSDRLAELRAMPSWDEPEAYRGSIGRTMFDTPGAKDNTITVLLPTESLQLTIFKGGGYRSGDGLRAAVS